MKTLIQILLTFVLNALWQGTLIVGFAAAGDWLLRGVAPRFRHYLWVVTLLACLIIPALSCLPLPSFTAANTAGPPRGPIPVVTSRIITPGIDDVSDRPVRENSAARPRFSLSPSVPVPEWIAFGLVGLYALIGLWRLVALRRAWRRTNQIVASAFECAFPNWVHERIDRCQSELGVKSCRVLCSNEIAVPITAGVFDRIVILPQRFAREVSMEVLTSALGHEFQHIARHDYLLNLVYEFIYLPLAFHPAVAFARRRIKHTRELCCDAAVTTKLVSAEVYARSLVKLIGSAPLLPLTPDTTIGMNESDILEVRIMALFKKSKLSSRTRVLLLVAASLLLITPCVAAARFALIFDTSRQSPSNDAIGQRKQEAWKRTAEEQKVVELEAQAIKLYQRLAQMPPQDERAAIEAKLNDVKRSLEESRKVLGASQSRDQDAEQRLKQFLEAYQENHPTDEARLKELVAGAKTKSPAELESIRQLMENLAAEQAASQGDRKPRLLSHTEAQYPDDARANGIEGKVVLGFNIDPNGIPQDIQVKQSLYPSLDQAAIEAVRSWKFEPAMKNGQAVSKWIEVQINFNHYQDPQKKEEQETRERREKEQVLKAWQMDGQDGQEIRVRMGNEGGRRAEREAQQKQDAILAGLAKISMDHAIQIATSKVPGKVTECSLVGEHWEGPGELAKPSLVLYHVVVLSEEATPIKTHVLINAMDGSIFRVNKEDAITLRPFMKSEEEMTAYATVTDGVTTNRRTIDGGVLNGKASSMPAPQYPAVARDAHVTGSVNVRVVIDGDGNIVEATAVSGPPLLRAAAQAAAKEAKFTPTRLSGEPVAVTGVLVYNFVAQ